MAQRKLIQNEYDKFQVTSTGDVAVRVISVTNVPAFGQLLMSGSAIQLPNGLVNNGVILQAKSSNTNDIMIGGSGVNQTEDGTGNGFVLEPAFQITFAADNLNELYAIGNSGDVLSYAGS